MNPRGCGFVSTFPLLACLVLGCASQPETVHTVEYGWPRGGSLASAELGRAEITSSGGAVTAQVRAARPRVRQCIGPDGGVAVTILFAATGEIRRASVAPALPPETVRCVFSAISLVRASRRQDTFEYRFVLPGERLGPRTPPQAPPDSQVARGDDVAPASGARSDLPAVSEVAADLRRLQARLTACGLIATVQARMTFASSGELHDVELDPSQPPDVTRCLMGVLSEVRVRPFRQSSYRVDYPLRPSIPFRQ